MSTLDDRLREHFRLKGCDWFDTLHTRRCRSRPNVAVTDNATGLGVMAFCAEHTADMNCPMLSLDTGELIPAYGP